MESNYRYRNLIKYSTDYAIELNAHSLARYAKIAQDFEMVPIVEPEVIMDGDHNIETCYKVTSRVLKKVFNELEKQSVYLNGILLKPNMIVSGKKCNEQASVKDVSDMTLKCLSENVPSDVQELFSVWRQSNELATQHLNQMNLDNKNSKWNISFSYGRALQQPSLSKWKGLDENVVESQKELLKRSKLNSSATQAGYSINDENQ